MSTTRTGGVVCVYSAVYFGARASVHDAIESSALSSSHVGCPAERSRTAALSLLYRDVAQPWVGRF